MRQNREYIDTPLAVGAKVELPEAAAAHLLRVLRLGVGDACVLFNGDGFDYDCRLTAAGKRGGEAEVLAARPVGNESALRIVLLRPLGDILYWMPPYCLDDAQLAQLADATRAAILEAGKA